MTFVPSSCLVFLIVFGNAYLFLAIDVAASENTVVLRQAIERFGTPAIILSYNGYCFVGMYKRDPKKSWESAAFKEDLLGRGHRSDKLPTMSSLDQRQSG